MISFSFYNRKEKLINLSEVKNIVSPYITKFIKKNMFLQRIWYQRDEKKAAYKDIYRKKNHI